MRVSRSRWSLLLFVAILFAGCKGKPAANAPDPAAELQSTLAQLGPEDARLAERQGYCPVMPEVRLGEMGPPHKVVLKGQAVFVCCQNCVRRAQKDPDGTLAALKKLQERGPVPPK
jgi:hypothetical protein